MRLELTQNNHYLNTLTSAAFLAVIKYMAQNKGVIIDTPQTITETWADVGSEIPTNNFSFFTSYIDLDVNDSENVQLRYRAVFEEGGDDYIIPLKTIKRITVKLDDFSYEVNSDTDQKFVLEEEIDDTVSFIKLQVRALTAGTTPGRLVSVKYKQGYRQ